MKNRNSAKQALLKTVSLVLAMTITLKVMSMPALSIVSAENADFTHSEDEKQIMITSPELPDSAELEKMYIEQLFYGSEDSVYKDYGKTALVGVQSEIYEQLRTSIEKTAAGEIAETVFVVELSAPYVNPNESDYKNDFRKVITCLMADLPQDFYWFDKTEGYSIRAYYDTINSDKYYNKFSLSFHVSEDYADKSDNNYKIDVSKINSAKKAVENAQKIAAEYETMSDYEKILGYKNRICNLTEYNQNAANNSSTPYGDPWQLVYVFDDDPDTNVVCEGYAKAFQYLCDLGGIECYTVTGNLSAGTGAGSHMWNIVVLNGKSYLCDITNCDGNSIGSPDLLLLKGADESDANKCVFNLGGKVTFTYDKDTLSMYTDDIRTVSKEDYDPNAHEHFVCEGAKNCPDDVHTGHNPEKWTAWNDTNAMPSSAGNYYLTADVNITESWTPADGTSLCLNGHTVSAKNTVSGIIFIKQNKTFNLCDCVGSGKICGNSSSNPNYGGGVTNQGTFNMFGGEISENLAIHFGNGVYNRMTFNMYGGKIKGNKPATSELYNMGGGVCSKGEYIEGYVDIKSSFRMYGGEISENTSNIGGGVCNLNGSIFIYKGKIKENKVNCFNTSDGGGGLCIGSRSECYIYGGEITKNSTKFNGGVYIKEGNTTIGGNVVIKDNICDDNSNNLCLAKGFTVTLDKNNPLTENAYIGVSTEVKPSDGSPVDITGLNDKDYSKFFHSDDPAYEVNNSENGVVQLRVHTHNLVQYEAVSPTCTENGYDEHWVCEGENGCGKIFSDEDAKNELDEKPIIEKLKHDYEDKWRNDPEKHWKKCKNCDAVEPDSENSHDWDEGKITVEPTTEKEGEKTFTCEICGYERKEEIPKLEVSETTTPATSPSETTTSVTSSSETDPPVTPPSETEPPVTPPSETDPPVTPPSETDPPVTPPSETNPPVTPPSETTTPATSPSETTTPVAPPSETTTAVTSSSETDPPVTPPSETDPPVTPPSETDPPVTPPSETNPPVTPPSETDPPVTPPSETDPPVTPPSETDPPVTPPSETEPPVTPSTENSNIHGGFVIPQTSTSTNTATDPVSSYSETTSEEIPVQTSDTSMTEGVVKGSVSKRVESANYKVELSDSVRELASNVLTHQERLLTDSGSNAEILLTAEKIDSVSESDGIAVRNALNGFQVWQYLDINLYKIIDGTRYKLTGTDRAVTVKIVIPEALRENGAEYAMIRLHNGEAAVLKDLDNDADTITFETDRFSLYAFVYKDKKTNDDPPFNTGDDSHTSLFLAVGITSVSAAMTFSLIGSDIGGMSEEKKEKLYRKLIRWGKGGGKARRLIALALIFLILSYYYGIGKSEQCAR